MRLIIVFSLLFFAPLFAQQKDSLDGAVYYVGDHELLLMPTAYTMEKGGTYFEDYEVVFINITHAIMPGTHISFFSLFPITTDFVESFTLGIKQNLYSSPSFSGAAWASYTPKGNGLTLGGVSSFGERSRSFHLAIGGFKDAAESSPFELIYMAGFRYDLSRKFILMMEYTNLETGFEENFGGIFSFGIRFRGNDISWDIAAIRPLDDTGDLLFIPLIKAIFKF